MCSVVTTKFRSNLHDLVYILNLQGMCETIKARVGQSESIGQNKTTMNLENYNSISKQLRSQKWLQVPQIHLPQGKLKFFLSFFSCALN